MTQAMKKQQLKQAMGTYPLLKGGSDYDSIKKCYFANIFGMEGQTVRTGIYEAAIKYTVKYNKKNKILIFKNI